MLVFVFVQYLSCIGERDREKQKSVIAKSSLSSGTKVFPVSLRILIIGLLLKGCKTIHDIGKATLSFNILV